MAKAQYIGVNGVARKVKKDYMGVSGVARKVKSGYIGVGGVARKFFSGGTPVSTLPVGSIVKLNVGGTPKEFLVVHQGSPGPMYDESCNGIWLLMKDIYENRPWHSSDDNDYSKSAIHSYLNNTFLGMLDVDIQAVVNQVKIPYRPDHGNSQSVYSGARGLNVKVFLLSANEIGINPSSGLYVPRNEGANLSYFAGCANDGADSRRIASLNGSATNWWLRSPYCRPYTYESTDAIRVSPDGNWASRDCSYSLGIRPALIVSNTVIIDDKGFIKTT